MAVPGVTDRMRYCAATVVPYSPTGATGNWYQVTVALLSHQKLTEYVQIPYEPEDKTVHAFRDATYKEIKDWIKKVFDMKVSSLYIAQIKDECGLEKRQNYNKSKKENAKVPTCPKEKRKAILAALRHFQMIDNE